MTSGEISRRKFVKSAGLLTATAAVPSLARSASQRPNVLFILADDMGYADLGCFGSRHISTPNIDRLAKQGVRMTDAYANSPVCSPTRLSLATGRYNRAFRTGLIEPFRPGEWGETAIPEGYPTYMKLLQQAGYHTSLIGKWHLGPTPAGSPLNYGYDKFFGFLGGGIDYFTHEYLDEAALMEGSEIVEREGYITTLLADEAIKRIEESSASNMPFAISLHFNAPHWPWEGPEDFALGTQFAHHDGGSLETYAEMVESMDRNIGRVLVTLDNLGLTSETLVIFTSDNGGERFSEVWPFRGTKAYLLEGGIRVPTIVRYPDRIPANKDSDQIAMTMDWYPTILSAANVPYDAQTIDGISLLEQLSDGWTTERSVFWGFQGHRQRAARRGNWKYYRIDENEFLFDLSRDQHERANRANAEPVIFSDLVSEWNDWNAAMAPSDGIKGFCLDPRQSAGELQIGPETNCNVPQLRND